MKGILHLELLDLHPAVASARDDKAAALRQDILALLRSFGLAYASSNGSFYYIPTRCQDRAPPNLFREGFPGGPVGADPPAALLFGKRVHFKFGVPDSFAENVIVSLQSQLVKYLGKEAGAGVPCIVQQWEHGTLFQACLWSAEDGGDLSRRARLRILLHVPRGSSAAEALEILWMLSESGEASSPGFRVDPEVALYVERWLARFHQGCVAPLAEKFSPFLRPDYQTLQARSSEARAHTVPAPPFSSLGTLEQMGLEDVFCWQQDIVSGAAGKSQRSLSAGMSVRSYGSPHFLCESPR